MYYAIQNHIYSLILHGHIGTWNLIDKKSLKIIAIGPYCSVVCSWSWSMHGPWHGHHFATKLSSNKKRKPTCYISFSFYFVDIAEISIALLMKANMGWYGAGETSVSILLNRFSQSVAMVACMSSMFTFYIHCCCLFSGQICLYTIIYDPFSSTLHILLPSNICKWFHFLFYTTVKVHNAPFFWTLPVENWRDRLGLGRRHYFTSFAHIGVFSRDPKGEVWYYCMLHVDRPYGKRCKIWVDKYGVQFVIRCLFN